MRLSRNSLVFILSLACLAGVVSASRAQAHVTLKSSRKSAVAPRIRSLLKPVVYRRAMNRREIMTDATLDGRHYTFYATMLVRANIRETRKILTDYELYGKMISYIDKTRYTPERKLLELAGGIWKWRLHSWIHFNQRSPNWIQYTFVAGNFTGMKGDILFESRGARGTLVYMRGGLTQSDWPPKLIIEEGAEIVFGFTGRRMRSYIENYDKPVDHDDRPDKRDDQNVPQPRSRL